MQEYNVQELSDDTRALWQRTIDAMQARGATIVPVSLPHTRYALPAYYMIACAEASSNLARYSGIEFGMSIFEITLRCNNNLFRDC